MTISNIIGCTGSVILVLFVSMMIPIFGPFFSLLTPLPFLFYTSKLGLEKGIKVCFITLLIIGIVAKLLGHPYLVLFCLEYGIMGLILSELFRRNFSYSLTVFWGTLLMLFVVSGFIFFITITKGVTPIEMVLKYIQTNLDATIGLYKSKGLDPQVINQLKQVGPIIADLIKKTYPSLVIIGTGFVIWINIIISKPLFLYKGIKYPDLGRSDMWKAPEHMVWGLILAGFSLLLSISALEFIALNVLIVFSVIYAFHGLSIVLFFFNKHHVPPWARFIIYAIILFQQMFVIILALMGLFDQWIDFRKINSNKPQVTE